MASLCWLSRALEGVDDLFSRGADPAEALTNDLGIVRLPRCQVAKGGLGDIADSYGLWETHIQHLQDDRGISDLWPPQVQAFDDQNTSRPLPQFVGGQSAERSPVACAIRSLL